METPQQRLSSLLEHLGIKANRLSKEIGLLRAQALYDIEKGKIQSITADLAKKITTRYPEFNLVWLTTGEGEMLKSQEPPQQPTLSNEIQALLDERAERINDLKYTIELQRDKIKLLEGQIKICEEKSEKVSTRVT